jgi:hypothetical protein
VELFLFSPLYPSWHERERLSRPQVNGIFIFMGYKIKTITPIDSKINNIKVILNISLKN